MADRVQGKPAEAPGNEPPRDADAQPRDVDAQATALQERTDTAQVVSAIEEVGLTRGLEESKPVKRNPPK